MSNEISSDYWESLIDTTAELAARQKLPLFFIYHEDTFPNHIDVYNTYTKELHRVYCVTNPMNEEAFRSFCFGILDEYDR